MTSSVVEAERLRFSEAETKQDAELNMTGHDFLLTPTHQLLRVNEWFLKELMDSVGAVLKRKREF